MNAEKNTILQKNMTRALELRKEIFDLANSFGGDETGHVAVMLHESANCISRASVRFNSGPPNPSTNAEDAMLYFRNNGMVPKISGTRVQTPFLG
jgi:hypothetical protein